jgi:hypothetical protein
VIKDKGYIFGEVSAKSGQNITNVFYKDIHDAIMYKFKIGLTGGGDNMQQEDGNKETNITESK